MLLENTHRRSRRILTIFLLAIIALAVSIAARPRAALASASPTHEDFAKMNGSPPLSANSFEFSQVVCYKITKVVPPADSGMTKITAVNATGTILTIERVNVEPRVVVNKHYWFTFDEKTHDLLDVEETRRCTSLKK